MANKKGAIHVDWAISMGLFLLYVTLLFILIKPGAEVEYKPDNLFTIIENNFFPETMITLKEINIIIDRCIGRIEPTEITVDSTSNNYRFTKLTDVSENRDISNDDGIDIGNRINIKCRTNPSQQEDLHDNIQDEIFLAVSFPEKHINFNDPNMIPTYNIKCRSSLADDCKASLGTASDFTGFSEEYIEELKKVPYETLRERWGFPASKKFKITSTKLKNDNTIEISDGTEPPAGVNIFAKEYPGVYLNRFNDRENMKVKILVW